MALFFYKEKNKDIRAAAYLRLSIEDGDKAESNSIGNQRELIRDFAAERPGLPRRWRQKSARVRKNT